MVLYSILNVSISSLEVSKLDEFSMYRGGIGMKIIIFFIIYCIILFFVCLIEFILLNFIFADKIKKMKYSEQEEGTLKLFDSKWINEELTNTLPDFVNRFSSEYDQKIFEEIFSDEMKKML